MGGLDPKERFDRVNEARKTLAQIIGGIAVLAGFYSTVQNLKVAQESLALAQQGQITDRFTKAIEQLGAVDSRGQKKLEVRLGGIYALKRIADESEQDKWSIIQVLTAYMRDNASIGKQEQLDRSIRAKASPVLKPEMDVQAILTVLGTTEAEPSLYKRRQINLSETDISGANLVENHYEYVDFREAHLNEAYLNGGFFNRAYFNGANLSEADLQGAILDGANLSGANLETAKNLDQKQIDSAIGDTYTKLPSNLHMPESWKQGHQ